MKSSLIICTIISSFMFPHLAEAKGKIISHSIFRAGQRAIPINGIKTYDSNTLRPTELKKCFDHQNEIDISEKQLAVENQALKKKDGFLISIKSEIQDLDGYLKLNRNSKFNYQSEIDAFNIKVDRYNDLAFLYNNELKLYKSLEAPYNVKVNAHNTKVDKFQIECAGKSYYMEDITWNIIQQH